MALVDSDDYLVVEMQKRDHEHQKLIPGPLSKSALADQLSEWTTAQHRENASRTLVFHAGDVPASAGDTIAEADRYVASVGQLLSPQPQPYRGHHYWVGSIAVNRRRTGRPLNREDWQFLLSETPPQKGLVGLPSRLRRKIMGVLPEVTRLHPRWPDYRVLLEILAKAVSEDRRLLLVADEPAVFAHWLTKTNGDVTTIEFDRLLSVSPARFQSLFQPVAGKFTDCVVLLPEAKFHHAGDLIDRLAPLLAAEGRVSVVAMNERSTLAAAGFAQAFARHSSRLLDLSMWVADAQYVSASRWRWRTYRAFKWFADQEGQSHRRVTVLLGLSLCVAPLALMSWLTNGAAKTTPSPARDMLKHRRSIAAFEPETEGVRRGRGQPSHRRYIDRASHRGADANGDLMRKPPRGLRRQIRFRQRTDEPPGRCCGLWLHR